MARGDSDQEPGTELAASVLPGWGGVPAARSTAPNSLPILLAFGRFVCRSLLSRPDVGVEANLAATLRGLGWLDAKLEARAEKLQATAAGAAVGAVVGALMYLCKPQGR
jgi:hypothetical protein